MKPVLFGHLPDGREVQSVTLRCESVRANVLTMGAIVQGLWFEDLKHSLVLGTPDLDDYLGPARYFGAIVGRFANRIGNGRFKIDETACSTDLNFRGRHTLHGGSAGTDVQVWQIIGLTDNSVTLLLTLADGHMGFPGNIEITARIFLEPDALCFDLSARSDAPTPCSLAHHGYFDLDGSGDVRDQTLMIAAEHYLPVNDDLIPTGEIAVVDGTGFDFRKPRLIGDHGYDHNFCLSDTEQPLRPVARLAGRNGLMMDVETTCCGLQLYDGSGVDVVAGVDRHRYGAYSGIALETQHWPDAVNQPGFPDAILRPEHVWSATTVYRFMR